MGIITGDRVNGAARWMTFMGLQFQPSELAKMAVIIAVSVYPVEKGRMKKEPTRKAFKYIMILTGLVLILIAGELVDSHVAVRCRIHDDVHRTVSACDTEEELRIRNSLSPSCWLRQTRH